MHVVDRKVNVDIEFHLERFLVVLP